MLFAFLLVVPFNARFAALSSGQRHPYLASLLCLLLWYVIPLRGRLHHLG